MSNADEERKNILLICNLVGFLINQITRDQAEWDSWGKEFVANIFLIQFDDEKVVALMLYYLIIEQN